MQYMQYLEVIIRKASLLLLNALKNYKMAFVLPELPYDLDALEPYISKRTLEARVEIIKELLV